MRRVLKKSVLGLVAGAFLAPAAAQAVDVDYGFYHRFRQETWDNAFDLNNHDDSTGPGFSQADRNFFRMKTSLWGKMDFDKKFGAFTKLTNEAQYYFSHSNPDQESFDEDELVFDNLFVYANDFLGLPVDLSLGRQDFVFKYGEGFLIMDGTPLDGSRTFYFDAAKANIKFTDNHSLDLVYIENPDDDEHLPSIYQAQKRNLNTSDEQGIVVYSRNKFNNLSVEPYYIFKNEEMSEGPDFYADAGELDLHTFGARATYKNGHWDARGEFAWQTGEYDVALDREGYGGYAFVGYLFKDVRFSPRVELGFVSLSGDDPTTLDEDEAFNPLFSRWPWLSELTILTEAVERGIAYTTNQQWYRARLTLALTENTGFNFWYNYIRANEETSPQTVVAPPLFSHTDKDRGHLFQTQISHKFTKAIDGYLRVEVFDPGDFYANDDTAMFVRWQLQFKF